MKKQSMVIGIISIVNYINILFEFIIISNDNKLINIEFTLKKILYFFGIIELFK